MDRLASSLVETAGPLLTVIVFGIALLAVAELLRRLLIAAFIGGQTIPTMVLLTAMILSGGYIYDHWKEMPTGRAFAYTATLTICALVLFRKKLRRGSSSNLGDTEER